MTLENNILKFVSENNFRIKIVFGYCSLISILFCCNSKAQIISNNGAFLSATMGTVIGTDSIFNNPASSLINDGILNSFTINNAGNIQGNGTYNVSKRFSNSGTFTPGTSSVNYTSSGDQIIATVNYYDLNITPTGSRVLTFPSTGIIGVANVLSLAGGGTTYSSDGSTLNFNGTSNQSIPAFPFTNLQVDNAVGATFSGTSTVSDVLKVNGLVDVPPQNIVSVSFPLGGYLKHTTLLPGMHVSKG